MQLVELAGQIRQLLKKYDDLSKSPRLYIREASCPVSNPAEGWTFIRVQLPFNTALSFEIENAHLAEQFKEISAFATEFLDILNKHREKYGSKAKRFSFSCSDMVRRSHHHR